MKLWKCALAAVAFLWILRLFHVQINPLALGPTWTRFVHQFNSERQEPEDLVTLRNRILSQVPGDGPNGDIKKRMKENSEIEVYFATERAQIPSKNNRFAMARDPERKITYGELKVRVPAAQYGRFDTSRPIVDIDMPAEFQNSPVQIITADQFYAHIFQQKPLLLNSLFPPVIYVHGFNNSLPEELWKAAKLKRDAELDGPMIVFDWPSSDHAMTYLDDRNAIENSADPLADFIEATYQRCGGCKLDMLAHSLGSRILIRSLRILSDRTSPTKVGHMVFVAPDVDPLFFQTQLTRLEASGTVSKVVVYGSQADAALYTSRRRNGYDPVGLFPAHAWVPNMAAIDVTDVPQSNLGHDYFVSSLEVEADIGCLLNHLPHANRKISKDPSTPGVSRLVTRDFFSRDENP